MARPERKDADYFPFYARDGKTLYILEGKYKCKGTGFFTNVLRFLTLREDHYFSISDESDRLYFFAKCHCDEESGIDMLNIMAKTGKIHTSLWVSCKVIVSEDLLKGLEDAYRNRKNSIITIKEIEDIFINNNKNPQESVVSDVRYPQEPVVSDIDNPQRKLKETKGNNNIYSNEFELFWKACEWNSKGSKKSAYKEWKKNKANLPTLNELISIVKKQISHKNKMDSLGKFCAEFQHVERWIKNARWEDEINSNSKEPDFGECPICHRPNIDLDEGICIYCHRERKAHKH